MGSPRSDAQPSQRLDVCNQGREGERLGLAQAHNPTLSFRRPRATVVQFIARGILAHYTVHSARGWDCPERTQPPARATPERQSNPPLPARVPFPAPHPHPSLHRPPQLSIPRWMDPRSFWHRHNLPKTGVIYLLVARCDSNLKPLPKDKIGPTDGHHSTPGGRTHRGAPGRDLRCRHNLLSHSNPQAHTGAPSLLARSSGQIRNWSAREWTGAPAASAAQAGQ